MRILVVPASKHGGTAEIGRAVARTLRDEGFDVDVSQPEHLHDLSIYSGFVLGSALYLGRWLPAAERFVRRFDGAIRTRPTWLFSSGPLGPGHPPEPIEADRLDSLMAATGATEHRVFGCRLVIDRLEGPDRFLAEWIRVPEGDHRDWDEIAAWTRSIAARLREASTVAGGTPTIGVAEGRERSET